MVNALKLLLAVAAVMAVIFAGLFWPAENEAEPDPFEMAEHTLSYDNFRDAMPEMALEDIVPLHTVYSRMDDIRSGRFQYRENYFAWRFTAPIDWRKTHEELDVRRVIQRVAMADPFLRSYATTGQAGDFRQAVFFLLDWQKFYQEARQTTVHAWDIDAARGRAARLAFVLSEINRDRTLLPRAASIKVMHLADFHVQRMVDPVYGAGQDTILDTPEFAALCKAVKLPDCNTAD